MGKWCHVKCDCSNREPLPNSSLSYEPYRNKRRLNARERKEQEEWREKVYEMYRCGHREGALVAFAPGMIFTLSYELERVYKDKPERFPIFRRIGNWRNYEDEFLLSLSAEEAALWKKEIEQLRRYLSGEEHMSWDEFQTWNKEWNNWQSSVEEGLGDALKLCDASTKTVNPVEFFL